MPSHWENVNTEEPYQVRIGMQVGQKCDIEKTHQIEIILTSSFFPPAYSIAKENK